ncbi:MAG: flagellar hook-associated protein FlgK [Proteobacteria bacterium]|nr:flagellar hook-associated protein FlgK [Pseudomonadota bacterium]
MAVNLNIFNALHVAKQGMAAGQAGLSVTGQNVANVNTEGYTRRRLLTSAAPGQPFGGGVEIDGVKRYKDTFASSRLIEEQTLLGNANQRAEILTNVSDLFNDLDDNALGAALDNFFGSIRVLQSTPTDATARQEVLARGEELANTFNRISSAIESVRENTDNLLRASAAEINIRTDEIARINDEISIGMIQGVDVSDLCDNRDQLVLEIAEHVKVSVVESDDGQITLFLEGGTPLVEGRTQSELQVSASAAPGTARVEYLSSNGQVSDITNTIKEGSMGGTLEVRDTILPGLADDVDQLAYDLAGAFNIQHRLGVGLDGSGPLDFFTPVPASSAGFANQIALDPTVDGNPDAVAAALNLANLPGGNGNALALAALADQDLAATSTQTFNEAYATLVGEAGVETRRANDEAAMRETAIAHIETIRDSSAGVSLDEEMTNLIQYQRAYQASARVLSVISETIQALINLR